MFSKSLVALLCGALLSADLPRVETLGKILEYTKDVFYKRAEVLVNFEYGNRIGVAWFEMGEGESKTATYNFNYMRFDTAGKVLLDMRDFKVKPANIEDYGIDWERSIPTLHCFGDSTGNTWLVYSYSKKGWRIGWVQIDHNGNVVAEDSSIMAEPTKPMTLVASAAKELGIHLFWTSTGPGIYYYNPQLNEPLALSKRFFYTETGVGLPDSRFLLISPPSAFRKSITPDSFEYRIIDDNGNLLEEYTLPWRPHVAGYWENVDLPRFYEAYMQDSVVNFVFPYDNRINLITFTDEGQVIKPETHMHGLVSPIEDAPGEARRFVKIHKGVVYYFAFDDRNTIYYWNSLEYQGKQEE